MAKRFTDTEKWRDDWWGSLPNDYRMIWLYLVDSCSIAGIWKKDFRGLNFNCNTSITEEEFLKVFGARVIDRGNFFFIPKFLRFQCPNGLGSRKPAVVSIVKELQLNNLIETVKESLGNDFLIIKGKGKGTGKGKDKGEGKGRVQGREESDDVDLSDWEGWANDVITGNDEVFLNMLRNEAIEVNGQLDRLARDHLGLLSEYPRKRPADQQRYRYSLMKHIRENLNKPKGKIPDDKMKKFDQL